VRDRVADDIEEDTDDIDVDEQGSTATEITESPNTKTDG
jgi:preprotein translocase subunit YajC